MTTKEKVAQGWRRHHELRRQDLVDKQEIIKGLTKDLGRDPTTNDLLAIEDIASLTIWARVLERRGKFADAAEIRRQVNLTRKGSNLKPQPINAQKQESTLADLAANWPTREIAR